MTLLAQLYATPWAILPAKFAVLHALVVKHASGDRLSAEEIQAATAPRPAPRSAGAIAVLPVFGTIVPHADLVSQGSGGTSPKTLSAAFAKLVNSQEVAAIVLDVDSPGGAVPGIAELTDQIYQARGIKPVVAVADHLAASAAYWLATAASEFVVSPSADVGSIGVFAAHEDVSALMEREGVKVNLISAGKHKTEGNPFEPLTDEARAAIQSRVDGHYADFVKHVARNRGVSVDAVRNGFGEGRVVGAREAVQMGMADRVGTLDETLERLSKQIAKGAGRSPSAELEFRQRRARALGHQ